MRLRESRELNFLLGYDSFVTSVEGVIRTLLE